VRTTWIMVLLLLLTGLTACAPSAAPIVPTAPTRPPSALPTLPPSPIKPGGGLVTRPQAEEWQNAPEAALSAAADLAQRLQIDIDTIKLVSVEQVDWPDACMGIQQPGVMCAQVITSGYKVMLEANGKPYEYHTNTSGSVVRLVGAS
jgi:hypothetical protein